MKSRRAMILGESIVLVGTISVQNLSAPSAIVSFRKNWKVSNVTGWDFFCKALGGFPIFLRFCGDKKSKL